MCLVALSIIPKEPAPVVPHPTLTLPDWKELIAKGQEPVSRALLENSMHICIYIYVWSVYTHYKHKWCIITGKCI